MKIINWNTKPFVKYTSLKKNDYIIVLSKLTYHNNFFIWNNRFYILIPCVIPPKTYISWRKIPYIAIQLDLVNRINVESTVIQTNYNFETALKTK